MNNTNDLCLCGHRKHHHIINSKGMPECTLCKKLSKHRPFYIIHKFISENEKIKCKCKNPVHSFIRSADKLYHYCDICESPVSEKGISVKHGIGKNIDFTEPTGKKDDSEKDRWDLLPLESILPIVKVLTYGARKYAPNNWKYVDNWEDRYYSAMMRHITSWKLGEKKDPETGLPHLAHAACCLLFMLSKEKEEENNE